jgi:FKBP-type peptidyl-prolyl cis-trans isomerase FklB
MKKKTIGIWVVVLMHALFISCTSNDSGRDKRNLETYMDTVSYIIGLDYGTGIREEQIDVNPEAVFRGLADGLEGNSLLSDADKDSIINDFNKILTERLEEEARVLLEQNQYDGAKFMEENLEKEGVIELPSGLQYKVLKAGSGPKPAPHDSVFVHYRAMFIDRSVFDMSYDRGPAGFIPNEVIPGLSEGILLMNTGSIFELFIPPHLAYGDTPFANLIPGGTTLIYSIELIEIKKQKKTGRNE